jgi:hypothetical protein
MSLQVRENVNSCLAEASPTCYRCILTSVKGYHMLVVHRHSHQSLIWRLTTFSLQLSALSKTTQHCTRSDFRRPNRSSLSGVKQPIVHPSVPHTTAAAVSPSQLLDKKAGADPAIGSLQQAVEKLGLYSFLLPMASRVLVSVWPSVNQYR